MSQYIARQYTDSNGTTWTMQEAQYATRGPWSGRRWYTCQICNGSFPEDEVVLSGGAAFCVKKRHCDEIHEARK